ncbi:MAG TPA: hypothetical protein DEQ28_08865 [Clostridiales bacterium]|nr:hypothetical protein [Clostridiales bacterium]
MNLLREADCREALRQVQLIDDAIGQALQASSEGETQQLRTMREPLKLLEARLAAWLRVWEPAGRTKQLNFPLVTPSGGTQP